MAAAPRLVSNAAANAAPPALVMLLRVEGEARAVENLTALKLLIANETTKLMRARQAFVFRKTRSGAIHVEAASSVAEVDRQVPLMQWLENIVSRVDADVGLGEIREFTLQAYSQAYESDDVTSAYPFQEALWIPLKEQAGDVFAGILVARERAWRAAEATLAQRIAVAFAQAWYWQATTKPLLPRLNVSRRTLALGALLAVGIACIPVSLTTLAPLEIGPRDSFLVTAPMDGVIEEIVVTANTRVAKGDVLMKFSDTVLRNRLAVAEREVQVADARVKKVALQAISDIQARHELAAARAELAVKSAERDYARDLLGRSVVRAAEAGVVLVGDSRELIGQPVSTGERIMEIADPSRVEVRIDVPVADAIVLSGEKRAKLFLDSDPLRPREATLLQSDYRAKSRANGTFAFRSIAQLNDQEAPPRLGLRGTAQLYGERVPLIYYVLRRPITFLRQWMGM